MGVGGVARRMTRLIHESRPAGWHEARPLHAGATLIPKHRHPGAHCLLLRLSLCSVQSEVADSLG
jgi:hypothetical protein